MPETTYDGPIFFVGGAPRSGTTVTHALLCTSARMSAYHPEISYVTPIIKAYTVGLNNWTGHTRNFFAEREHFRQHIHGLANQAFSYLHLVLKHPEMLCVKDPLMTPFFPSVRDLFAERARFVTVVRHPYDVIRSRQEVASKAQRAFTVANAHEVARQYNQAYQHIDNPAFGDKLIYFRYEDLLSDAVQDRIKEFTGCEDISTENVWGERKQQAATPSEAASKDPWYSPKYHGSIDLTSRLSPLADQYREVVDKICGKLMQRFDYETSRILAE